MQQMLMWSCVFVCVLAAPASSQCANQLVLDFSSMPTASPAVQYHCQLSGGGVPVSQPLSSFAINTAAGASELVHSLPGSGNLDSRFYVGTANTSGAGTCVPVTTWSLGGAVEYEVVVRLKALDPSGFECAQVQLGANGWYFHFAVRGDNMLEYGLQTGAPACNPPINLAGIVGSTMNYHTYRMVVLDLPGVSAVMDLSVDGVPVLTGATSLQTASWSALMWGFGGGCPNNEFPSVSPVAKYESLKFRCGPPAFLASKSVLDAHPGVPMPHPPILDAGIPRLVEPYSMSFTAADAGAPSWFLVDLFPLGAPAPVGSVVPGVSGLAFVSSAALLLPAVADGSGAATFTHPELPPSFDGLRMIIQALSSVSGVPTLSDAADVVIGF